jgi:BolA family transcriptional regulator, general stress-responsive regulator
MNTQRVAEIRKRLEDALGPELLEVEDESHHHIGHAGARDGRGHFRVTIVSSAFAGKSRIGRHRLVYEAMGDLMRTDIHALTVQALAPNEL